VKAPNPILYSLTFTLPTLIEQEWISYQLNEQGFSACELGDSQDNLYIRLYQENKIKLLELQKKFGSLPSKLEISGEQAQNWKDNWKQFLKPVHLAGEVWIPPPGLLPPRGDHPDNIIIQPQMAFGTGHHASTRLVAKALQTKQPWIQGKRLVDLGTGSGILLLLANHWGCEKVLGIENDLDCFDNLIENQRLNQVSPLPCLIGEITCLKNNLNYHIGCINMIRSRSLPLIEPLINLLQPGGYLIWSGIEVTESQKIKNHLHAKMSLECEFNEDQWWCGLYKIL